MNGFLPIILFLPILGCLTTLPDSYIVPLYKERLSLARRGGSLASVRLSGSGLAQVESQITNAGVPNHHDKPHDKLDQSNTAYFSNNQRHEIKILHGDHLFAVKNGIIRSHIKMW